MTLKQEGDKKHKMKAALFPKSSFGGDSKLR
jgi:hypothetical protein